MTDPEPVPGPPETSGPFAIVALALAAAGVAAAVGLWVALASITGLIYHLLPGATFLAAAWVFRRVERDRRPAGPELVVIVVTGALGTISGAALVIGIGRELDPAPVTGLVATAGALLGAAWLRRGARFDRDHGSEVRSS